MPDSRFELDAYAARLATVARAVETVEDAYTRPLRARAELRYSLERLAARADANGRSASPTVRSGLAEAREAVETTPCDVTLARFLVEQYQFLTRDLPTPEGASS
ncbi:hypothetical protein QVL82_19995 [Cellulosimicrobium funkei]|uniref:hypothetical protein n=1 Tax=Cellulosimicrobium funkei TaxID=264251 RepID=UPI0002D79659